MKKHPLLLVAGLLFSSALGAAAAAPGAYADLLGAAPAAAIRAARRRLPRRLSVGGTPGGR